MESRRKRRDFVEAADGRHRLHVSHPGASHGQHLAGNYNPISAFLLAAVECQVGALECGFE